jgi:hypothetical protein
VLCEITTTTKNPEENETSMLWNILPQQKRMEKVQRQIKGRE